MKLFILTLLSLVLLSCTSNNEIKNNTFNVNYSNGKLTFVSEKTGSPFLINTTVGQASEDDAVEITKVSHPIWGEGKEMIITEKASGNQNKISLYKSIPFVMLQRVLKNSGANEVQIVKDSILSGQVSLGETTQLKSMSTAGLNDITEKMGGYVYMTIGNKSNYNGIVCGWLTNERGSGIVFSDLKNDTIQLSARIDYGDLRIPAGKNIETETLLIGYDKDIRNGLEKYADAIAENKDIVLPPMPTVYCTWYHAFASDENQIAKNTDFVTKNLKPFGINVMQIDDFWQSGTGENGPNRDFSKVDPKGPYPNGMTSTSNYIKKNGLVSGIWYIPFAGTWNDSAWADRQDYFLKQGKSKFNYFHEFNEKFNYTSTYKSGGEPYVVRWGGTCLDLTSPKVQEYIRETASLFHKKWGYNYFKLDGLWTGTGARLQYINSNYIDDDLGQPTRFNPEITAIEAYAKGLDIIREEVSNDVFLLGCSQTQNMRSFGPAMGRVDAMRVGPDNGANPKSLARGPLFSTRLFFLNKRVWYNDPDPVYVRPAFPSEMAKTSVSWTSLTGSLHSSSYQYEELPKERLDIFKRSLPSHNLKTVQPVDFLESDPARVWLLTDARGKARKDVIGLFNWDIDTALNVSYDLDRIKLPKAVKYVGFDFWENKFIPPFSESINALLPPGGCKIISVRPVKTYPQVISTSRHLTQGVIDLKKENWDERKKSLSGESTLIGGDDYELRIVVPIGDTSWSLQELTTNFSDDEVNITSSQKGSNIRIMIKTTESKTIKWEVTFKKGAIKEVAKDPIKELHAEVDLDRIFVNWSDNGAATFNLSRNGKILGEVNKNFYEDKSVILGDEYNYCVETENEKGNWTGSKCLTIKMPNKFQTPKTPNLPQEYCTEPDQIKGSKDIKIGMAHSGSPLLLDSKKYSRGIGVKGNNTLIYNIPEGVKYFVATVGLDDSVIKNKKSSVRIKVLGDYKEMGEPLNELGRSPLLTNEGNRFWNFKIKIDSRLRQLQLDVNSTDDGSDGDEVNWLNTGFIYSE